MHDGVYLGDDCVIVRVLDDARGKNEFPSVFWVEDLLGVFGGHVVDYAAVDERLGI